MLGLWADTKDRILEHTKTTVACSEESAAQQHKKRDNITLAGSAVSGRARQKRIGEGFCGCFTPLQTVVFCFFGYGAVALCYDE